VWPVTRLMGHAKPTKFEFTLTAIHKHAALTLLNQCFAVWTRFCVKFDPVLGKITALYFVDRQPLRK